MAYQVIRKPISDLDGKTEATHSVPVYRLDGTLVWFDLSEKEYKAHTEWNARYSNGGTPMPGAPSLIAKAITEETHVESGEVAPVVPIGSAGGGRSRPARQRTQRAGGPDDRVQKIRAWAKAQGIEVSDRGRVPKDVVEKFNAAQGAPAAQFSSTS